MNDHHTRRVDLSSAEQEEFRRASRSERPHDIVDFGNQLARKLGVGGPTPKITKITQTREFEHGAGAEARIVRVVTCAAYSDGSCGCISEKLDGTGGYSFVPATCP